MGDFNARKIEEAVGLCEEADKALKSGFFKKPDFDLAASKLEKAAQCFRVAKDYERCADALERAAVCQNTLDMHFMAATLTEQQANIMRDQLNNPSRAGELYDRSHELYMSDGKFQKAAEALAKAAKMIQDTDVDHAADYYARAAAIVTGQELFTWSGDVIRRACSFFAKNKRFDDLLRALDDAVIMNKALGREDDTSRALASKAIVFLCMDKAADAQVALDKAYSEYENFSNSAIAPATSDLVHLYKQGEPEQFTNCQSQQVFKHLDNEIARLVQSIKLPEGASADDFM